MGNYATKNTIGWLIDEIKSRFAGKIHSHTLSDMSDVTASVDEVNYLSGVTSNIQTQFNGKAASSHNHSASNITSGTLPVSRGGTGRTTTAKGAMYATSNGGAINMGTLPIAQGGTGKTTAADARSALGAAAKGWTQLASSTGTTSTKINLNDYNEVMIVARYSTSYLSSVVLYKKFLIENLREIYLGGGWYTGGDRRCCVRASTTSFAGLQCIVDGSVVTSSTNFYLYAR